jgi:hypothetical protein
MMIFLANVDPDAVRGGAQVYTLLAFIYGVICFWVPIGIYMKALCTIRSHGVIFQLA